MLLGNNARHVDAIVTRAEVMVLPLPQVATWLGASRTDQVC